MTGRGRTCDAPRFKRALYRLSYGHVNGRSRNRAGRSSSARRSANWAVRWRGSRSPRVCPAPWSGARRTCGPLWARFRSCIGSLVSSPTMLSMPLAYPSTLDHRLGARCPTRRGVGARRSPSVTQKPQTKVTRTYTCESGDTSWRTFLSRAGPQVRLELFKLSITFWLEVLACLQKQKRRPIGSPLCGGVCARSSERTSRKGQVRRRTGAPDRSYAGTA